MKKVLNRAEYILIFSTIFFLIFTLSASAQVLKVHFLDVGQADAIIIELPDNKVMVIDAGNNADGPFVVNYIKKLGIAQIDYLIGTHPHEDHIGGLDDVINTFKIGRVYMPQVTTTTKTFEDVLLAIKARGLKITGAKAGIDIIKTKDLHAQILAPVSSQYDKLNNWSIVLKLIYKNTSFLFTGDVEKESELELLYSKFDLNSDLLKVAHHGSDSSTSTEFLTAVCPDYAIISVGKDNSYGHPSPSTLKFLKKRGVKIFRTDLMGNIIAISDGRQITFNSDPVNPEKTNTTIIISSIDLNKEIVTLKNISNQAVDISNWVLESVKGEQKFVIPQGTILNPGDKLEIVSGKNATLGKNRLVWTQSYIWNNDGDPAILYDSKGNIIFKYGGM